MKKILQKNIPSVFVRFADGVLLISHDGHPVEVEREFVPQLVTAALSEISSVSPKPENVLIKVPREISLQIEKHAIQNFEHKETQNLYVKMKCDEYFKGERNKSTTNELVLAYETKINELKDEVSRLTKIIQDRAK